LAPPPALKNGLLIAAAVLLTGTVVFFGLHGHRQPGVMPPPAILAPAAATEQSAGNAGIVTQGERPNGPQRGVASASQPADTDSVLDVTVGRNDTLDRLFRKLGLSLADLAALRATAGIRTHLDNLRMGEVLHLRYHDTQLTSLGRRLNEEQTLQIARGPDGLTATVRQDPLEGRQRTIHAVIDRSLFEAVAAGGGHDQTAVNLADIFGWDIDFVLDIQPGDSFTVTYRELYQNGVYVKDGPVLAALFVNQGRRFRAVRYVDPTGGTHYYTPDGKSMRKAFLRAPVEFTRISSKFNTARLHPILNLIRAHKGIDYAAPMGTPVRAAGDGRISYAGPKGGYGNVVEIEHTRSIMTVYGHLARFAAGTRVGAHVAQGSVIAFVGMTGLATGPHLHYEFRVNGEARNPQTVAVPDAEPIEARWRDDFVQHAAPLLATLEPPPDSALVAR
jgi:murein DD-endopeptidase MepM/ murein hydrolase activator NlpD